MILEYFNRLKPLLLAAIAGFLWYSAFPPNDYGVISIILSFCCLLKAISGASLKNAALRGFVFGMVGFGCGCFWVVEVFRGWHGLLLVPVMSLWTVIFALGCSKLIRQESCIRFFHVALWWASLEFVRGEAGPIPNPVLTFGAALPTGLLLNPARYIGIYGMSFLTALFSALIYRMYWYQRTDKSIGKAFIAPFILGALWLGSGALITFPAESGREICLLGVQAEIVPVDKLIKISEDGLKKAEQEGKKIDAIVWPEYAIQDTFIEEDKHLQEVLKAFVRKHDTSLIFGNKMKIEGKSSGFLNTVFLMTPEGGFGGSASKSKPVPFLNDGEPTKAPMPIDSALGKIGIPICYDADFSLINRGIVDRGAEFLVIPTRDRVNWGWFQHMQRIEILRLRALENGRYILRVSTSGPTVAVTPRGEFMKGGAFTTDECSVIATIKLIDEKTFYTKYGYLLGYLMFIYSLIQFALLWKQT
jgi:apolipoprotein N-acyltransferase